MSIASTAIRASLLASLALAAVAAGADARPASQSARSLPNLVASSSADGSYTITNTGAAAAGNFKILIAYEYAGIPYDTLVVKGLPAGGSFHGSVGPGCALMIVGADARSKVAESNELDNTAEVQQTGCA